MGRARDLREHSGHTYEDQMLSDDCAYDYDYETDRPQPQCDRCGSYDVRWRQQGGKWVLFSLKPGVVHQCPIRDAFDVVPE